MKYHELTTQRQRRPSRVGRGIASGRGKTAGRGTKGQGARKSGGVRPGFEGGQTPLYMRLPHLRGFKSHRRAAEYVFTGELEQVKKTVIDNAALAEAGLVSSPYSKVKLITKGDLKAKKTVKLQLASAGAIKLVEKAGGSFIKIDRIPRSKQTSE